MWAQSYFVVSLMDHLCYAELGSFASSVDKAQPKLTGLYLFMCTLKDIAISNKPEMQVPSRHIFLLRNLLNWWLNQALKKKKEIYEHREDILLVHQRLVNVDCWPGYIILGRWRYFAHRETEREKSLGLNISLLLGLVSNWEVSNIITYCVRPFISWLLSPKSLHALGVLFGKELRKNTYMKSCFCQNRFFSGSQDS